mgnify:FL=1
MFLIEKESTEVVKRFEMDILHKLIQNVVFRNIIPPFLSTDKIQSLTELIKYGISHFIDLTSSREDLKIKLFDFPLSLLEDIVFIYDQKEFVLVFTYCFSQIFKLTVIAKDYQVSNEVISIYCQFNNCEFDDIFEIINTGSNSSKVTVDSNDEILKGHFRVRNSQKIKLSHFLVGIFKFYLPFLLEFRNTYEDYSFLLNIVNFKNFESNLIMIGFISLNRNGIIIRCISKCRDYEYGRINRL